MSSQNGSFDYEENIFKLIDEDKSQFKAQNCCLSGPINNFYLAL